MFSQRQHQSKYHIAIMNFLTHCHMLQAQVVWIPELCTHQSRQFQLVLYDPRKQRLKTQAHTIWPVCSSRKSGTRYYKITHYPEYSMANVGSHPMNRESQLDVPGLTTDKYITTQASEGQQTRQAESHLPYFLQNKAHEKPTEHSNCLWK
ncbi:hypothetical protein MJO29_015920 [Puccinia striiformis f. sp. tritici]|nr:hypothetical protein MJO29_015920 [Puccinia striiformis f. sp. tritici]